MDVLVSQYPDEPEDSLKALARAERDREEVFQAKVRERMERDLPAAVALGSAEAREQAIRALLDREKRYAVAREQAMLERAMGELEVKLLKVLSPEGAYWKLSEEVKEHTLDCLAVGERFWPWSVLSKVHPPVHHGCACYLLGLDEAIEDGLMTRDQVPDPADAKLRWKQSMDDIEGLEEAPVEVLDEVMGWAGKLALREAAVKHTGVMVALYPKPEVARAMAVEGGEPADEIHLTLAFLGDSADLEDAEGLAAVVAGFARSCPPLSGEVSGTGRFTAGENPVLYASADLPALPSNRERLIDALVAGGFPVSKSHGFTPHMTLAYDDREHDTKPRALRFTEVSLVVGGKRTDFALGGDELQEARAQARYAKGLMKGGQFRPQRGSSARAVLRALGGRPASPLAKRGAKRGRWAWVGGTYRNVPEADMFERRVGGSTYISPPGSTNVYRDGKLVSSPGRGAPAAEKRGLPPTLPAPLRASLFDDADEIRDRIRTPFVSEAEKPGRLPLKPGDGPSGLLAMRSAGYVLARSTPGPGGSRALEYRQRGTRRILRVTTKDGVVDSATMREAPTAPRVASGGPPASWESFASDVLAWADELGQKYGADVSASEVGVKRTMADHSGMHEWSGEIKLGRDTPKDIDAAAAARAEGRDLTDREKRGVWSSFWVAAHEAGHGVNPLDPDDAALGANVNLEEALTEEAAHVLAVKRLADQGQGDVLAWRDANPDAIAVRGVYMNNRNALGKVLDKALPPDGDRTRALLAMKFGVEPSERFAEIGRAIHLRDPSKSEEAWASWAQDAMTYLSNDPESGRPYGSLTPALTFLPSALQSPGSLFDDDDDEPSLFDDLVHGVPKWAQEKAKSFKPATIGSGWGGKPKSAYVYKPAPKAPPAPKVTIGGDGDEPDPGQPIPTYDHVKLEVEPRAGGGVERATGPDGSKWTVNDYEGDQDAVASEALSAALYRRMGLDAPASGVTKVPVPDFAAIPDEDLGEADGPIDAKGKRASTGMIVMEPDGRVWVYEPRGHFGGYEHTFPKGGVEDGLTAQQNAHKELWEETGLHARPIGVVGDFDGDTSVSRYYLAVRTGGEPTLGAESQAVKLATVEEAAKLLNKPRDKDILAAFEAMKSPSKKAVKAAGKVDPFPDMKDSMVLVTPEAGGSKVSPKGGKAKVAEGYMIDALLGSRSYGDVTWRDGEPVRSNPAALAFRPDGQRKPFGPVPTEVWKLQSPKGPAFGLDMSEDEMRAAAGEAAAKLSDAVLDELVTAAPFASSGLREEVREALRARRDWMSAFAAGEQDLPGPLSGDEARGEFEDHQANLKLLPPEVAALAALDADPAMINGPLRSGEKSEAALPHVKALDGLFTYAKGMDEDAVAYAPLDMDEDRAASGDLGGLVGKTFEEKGYLGADFDAERSKRSTAVMRVSLPAGQKSLYAPGLVGAGGGVNAGELLLPRGTHFRIVGRSVEDGTVFVDVVALPKPKPAPKPTFAPKSPKPLASPGTVGARPQIASRRATGLPSKPVFVTSNLAVKAENEKHADALEALALAGDVDGLDAYSAFNPKSAKVAAYKYALLDALVTEDEASPPKAPPAPAPTPPSTPPSTPPKAGLPSKPVFTTSNAKVKAANEKLADVLEATAAGGNLDMLKGIDVPPQSGKLVAYKASLVKALGGEAPKPPKPKPKKGLGADGKPWTPETSPATAAKVVAKLKALEQYGIKAVGQSNNLSDKQWLRVLESVEVESKRLNDRWPGITEGVRLVRTMPSPGALGVYQLENKTISLAPGDPGDGKASPGGWTVGGSARTVFRHELGHHVDYNSPPAKIWRDALKAMKFEVGGKPVDTATWAKANVSKYAGTNTSEALAEFFALYTAPNYVAGTLPEAVEAIMEGLASRKGV